MQPLEAHVHNGRLFLDEPTDLPEGEVVELVPLDDVLASGGEDLNDEERAALHRAIEQGIADAEAGRTVDARVVIDELRARTADGEGRPLRRGSRQVAQIDNTS